MKNFLAVIVLFFCTISFSQSIEFSEYVDTETESIVVPEVEEAIENNTTYIEVVIVAKDSGASPSLPAWFDATIDGLPLFFSEGTFGQFDYESIVLKAGPNQAFIFPEAYPVPFSGNCWHVHSRVNMIDVIEQADAIYDFSEMDFDDNNIVPLHFTSIGPSSGGVSGGCLTVITNDIGIGGQYVQVQVVQQTRGSAQGVFKNVFYHESGHTFFNFPDMNHNNFTGYNHYGIGAFDIMCGGGFQGGTSLYNPWFRQDRGWASPIPIENNFTGSFEDYQTSKNYYMYLPNDLPTIAFDYQKFIISLHTDDNQFYETWPFDDPDVGGMLIWHIKEEHVGYGGYYDWRRMDLDIESAHGKFIWDEFPLYVENTGVEDPLTGRDSLEIRKIVNGTEIQGPYFQKDNGSSSIFYTPDEAGDFAFYNNPNSNWYVNSSSESYAQSIVSGFSMKNLRTENNEIKADFYIDDFTISQSMTLPIGKWHFYNDITVAQGATLTLEAGTELYFYDGASLIVNGTLIAEGGPSGSITINVVDAEGNGIIVGNGCNFIINTYVHCYGNITLNGGNILGGGKIFFHDNKRIIVEGTSQILGSSGTIELDFIAPHTMNGIQVMQGANFRAHNCIVRNARNGITVQSNVSYFRASLVQFYDCSDYGINIYGPISLTPTISLCQFNNSSFGLGANNLSEILVQLNQFINNDIGINLINVAVPHINDNTISSNKKTLPGIFLESCNGYIRNNTISGHTNGIHLGNSSPDIGGNEITDNLYHGIYIGTGSLPNMEASLYSNPPFYYAISGYNDIKENGGTTTGGPLDNDGSEIFFSNSNALMREGCNSIYDDRSPGGEHPPYNTKLLMNGPDLNEVAIQADGNYWSNNPLYRLEERFGNLIVHYEPILPEPCEIAVGGGEELFVKSSSGEVIDTLYPLSRTIGTLSNTDLLYASAEEKFITANYDGAEELYNQVVNGSDSLVIKLQAHKRLYEIGKLNSKPASYFNNLQTVYSSLSQTTNDSLVMTIFKQLSSLSLVGEEEYMTAIDEFDVIIQQNPGSEEAVYAEIDALTTALLVEPGDSTLGKKSGGRYLVKSPSDYHSKISNLLKNKFGSNTESTSNEIIPEEFNLYQNYPNPFNPTTTIKYDIAKAGQVEIVIYDVLGNKIKTVVSEFQDSGSYEAIFNASYLASGVYFYQLRAKSFVVTKKMILLR